MTSPILALRAAILAACAADAPLAALMDGAPRLHDEPPRGAVPPYAVFGDVSLTDASTGTEPGHEQSLALVVWAKPGGAATALRVAERLAALLHEAALPLEGHHLVSLRRTGLDLARDEKTHLARATLRLRAVTEPL